MAERVLPGPDLMIYLGGQRERSWRCEDCGANVFRKDPARTEQLPAGEVAYVCNGCDARWIGVYDTAPAP